MVDPKPSTKEAATADSRAKPPTPTRDKSKKPRNTPTPQKMKVNGPVGGENQHCNDDMVIDDDIALVEPTRLLRQFDMPSIDDPTFWNTEINGPTKLWKEWKKQAKHMKPFTREDIFGEGPDMLHTLTRVGHHLIGKHSEAGKEILLKEDWVDLFTSATEKKHEVVDNERLMKLSLRLAKTDPLQIFDLTNDKLSENDCNKAWAAAYSLFGAPWKNRKHWKDQPTKKTASVA